MTTSSGRRFASGVGALGISLAFAVPSSRAMQPEPQMMFETGTYASAAPVAGMMAGAPGKRGGPEDMRGGPPPLFPPFIRLTGEQQEKLFELRQTQEPALRAQMKEVRNAHTQLRTLAMADTYDEARARQFAAQASQANSEMALMHARLQHAAFLLLTPEQRKRLDQCQPGVEGVPPPPECLGLPR